jgi:HK97 family phage major capsid protein
MSKQTRSFALMSAKKISIEDKKWLKFIVTAPTLDRDLDVIDTQSLRIPIKPKGWKYAKDLTDLDEIDVPFMIDHSWSIEDQLGSVRKLIINAGGELEGTAGMSETPETDRVLLLGKDGHLGNSISGTFDYSTGYVVDGVVYDAELIEVSVVFKGSNRNARVLEVSKSLLKEGKSMAKAEKSPELAEDYKELERITKKIEAAKKAQSQDEDELDKPEIVEKPEVTEESDAEKIIGAPKPTPEDIERIDAEAEADAEDEDDAKDEVKDTEEIKIEVTEEKEESKQEPKKMTKTEDIAVKQVVPAGTEPKATPKAFKRDDKAIKSLFVEQFMALKSQKYDKLAELNRKAMELDGLSTKVIDNADASVLYQSEVVSSDIREAFTSFGRVGALVNRIDIMGAETWKQIVEADGAGFRPVALGGTKQEDEPVWTPITIEPREHALIVAWYDAVARRTPIAVYQQIVRYIAKQYSRLEDKIILSFEGGTFGGETFEATGLVPLLVADGDRTVDADGYDAPAISGAIGAAYGLVESDETVTLVCNRATWGLLATSVDTQGRTIFNVVGNQVSAGALGTFNVVVSQEMADGQVVVGAFQDYELVTRGGLETLFSREATVGSVNLYTNDASALRANVDIAGAPVRVESFALIDFGSASS